MKVLMSFIFVNLFVLSVVAQNRIITGKVLGKLDNKPIAGAVVMEISSAKQVLCNALGEFQLNLSANESTLLIKHLGYKEKEIKVIAGTKTIIIHLEQQFNELEEIVAIGYGSMQKKDIVGAVSSVSAKDLKDIPINSAAQALAGRIAGLEVTAAEGSPDAEVKILIRGGNSITQDNAPLYIIDGIQSESGLSGLNPQDIETIDVLKDAASTAIYGARGANGVVIVTTKGGKEGNTGVEYNGLLGHGQVAKKLDVLDPYEFVLAQYERAVPGGELEVENFVLRYGNLNELDAYKKRQFIDWQDATFGRDAIMATHNLRISGGLKNMVYSISLTDNKQDGIVLNSGLKRKSLNFKLDHTASTKFKSGISFRYIDQKVAASGIPNEGASVYTMLRHAVKYTPYKPDFEEIDFVDDDYFDLTNTGNGMGILNPVALTNAMDRNNLLRSLNLGGYFSYQFFKELSFKTNVGYNSSQNNRESFDDYYSYRSRVNGGLPMAGLMESAMSSWNLSNVLQYNKPKIGKKHGLDAIIGQEIYENTRNNSNLQLKDFPLGITPEQALNQLGLGTVLAGYPNSNANENRLFSLFSRVNYNYDKRYLLTMSIRADGSSKFSPSNRWGFFPSVAGAWRISREDFMKNINVISDMKIRLSVGQSGNNRIADYLYQNNFNTTNIRYALNEVIIPGYAGTYLANPDLKWETTTSRNLGLDLSLLKNRIQLTFDAYNNTTKDLLITAPIPSTSGYATQLINVGDTQNKGFEFQIGAGLVNKEKFTWKLDLNMGFNKNTVKRITREQNQELYNSGFGFSNQPADYIVRVGSPVGSMFGWINDGFYKVEDFDWNGSSFTLKNGVADATPTLGAIKPGQMKLKDLNGDGVVNTEDRDIIGNSNPKFIGGINQQFTFWNFDLSVFLNFKYGNSIFNANKIEFTNGYTKHTNQLAIMKDRWRTVDENLNLVTDPNQLAELNKDAKIWTTLTGNGAYYPVSWAIEDGSFLRLNNITLGYSFSPSLLSKVKIKSLRVYGTVNNLAIWTNYSGFDPEVDTKRSTPLTPGVDYSAYPRSKMLLFGINLSL